jgi:putative hydrolase of the HAD superfamily
VQALLPKVIFFDAAGTLIHLPRGAAWHYVSVAAAWGIALDEEAVCKAFRQAWAEAFHPPETREARADDDKGWWRALVGRVLADCGVPVEMWNEAFFEALYSHFCEPGVWELYPDVLPALQEMRSRFRFGIISNFDGRLRRVLAHLGIAEYFDYWVISSEIGADKPSPYIFQKAADLACVSGHDALHVGDDPICDWEGASAAGWQVFELVRPGNTLSDLAARLGC